MRGVFDPNPGHRTVAEWRRLLGELVGSLCTYTGIQFTPTSWFVEDQTGYASANGCVDIRGEVSSALRLSACGVVSVSVNFGEAAWASCNLLLFSDGRRLLGPKRCELVSIAYTPEGWSSQGWVGDVYGEWESYETDARWAARREDKFIIS